MNQTKGRGERLEEGFTLLELMVVMAMMSLFFALFSDHKLRLESLLWETGAHGMIGAEARHDFWLLWEGGRWDPGGGENRQWIVGLGFLGGEDVGWVDGELGSLTNNLLTLTGGYLAVEQQRLVLTSGTGGVPLAPKLFSPALNRTLNCQGEGIPHPDCVSEAEALQVGGSVSRVSLSRRGTIGAPSHHAHVGERSVGIQLQLVDPVLVGSLHPIPDWMFVHDFRTHIVLRRETP